MKEEFTINVRRVGPGWMASDDSNPLEEPFAVGTAAQVAGAVRVHVLEKMGHTPRKRKTSLEDGHGEG